MKKEKKKRKWLCINSTAIFNRREALSKSGHVYLRRKDENLFELKKNKLPIMENLA
jgi:hypothetical protein